MKGYKKIEMANFNCTFGEKDDPMIKHFNDIIYPAFNSGIRRTKNKNEYLFEDIRLIKSRKDEFVLVGLLVKKTQLEVKSLYKEGKGIQPTNLVYDSDPYSAFAIFLKNHRMIYIKNQKGSPNIQTFGSTAREIIKKVYKSGEQEKREK